MSVRRSTRRTVALAIGIALALSACTSDDEPDADDQPSATPTPTAAAPAPPAPPPKLGACYRLSYDEALAATNADTPIACAKVHTSQTFAVGQLDLVANGHLLAVDSDRVRDQVAKRCPNKLASYLGATPEQLRLTLLRPVWFTPTLEQSDSGADWYRCDVIAVTGDSRVANLARDLAGALEKPGARADFGMCGTDRPGSPAFSHVLCREDHTWRAISVVDLAEDGRGRRLPGREGGPGGRRGRHLRRRGARARRGRAGLRVGL